MAMRPIKMRWRSRSHRSSTHRFMHGIALIICIMMSPTRAATVKAKVITSGQQIVLDAKAALTAASLADLSLTSLTLIDGGSGCNMPPLTVSTPQPFALQVHRVPYGGERECTDEHKMKKAIEMGAAALIVVDTLWGAYSVRSNDTARSLALTDPCLVNCRRGRGLVDPTALDVPSVLSGLPGSCPGQGCPTSLCAYSGRTKGASREVCCVLNSRADLAGWSSLDSTDRQSERVPLASTAELEVYEVTSGATEAAETRIPVLYLSISAGTALTKACFGFGSASSGAQRCTVLLGDDPTPKLLFDPTMLMTWTLATATAALAAFLAGSRMHRGSSFDEDAAESSSKKETVEAGDCLYEEVATIDKQTSVGFLLIASGGLLTMYFLIQVSKRHRTGRHSRTAFVRFVAQRLIVPLYTPCERRPD